MGPLVLCTSVGTYVAKSSDLVVADAEQQHTFSGIIHPTPYFSKIGEIGVGQINGYRFGCLVSIVIGIVDGTIIIVLSGTTSFEHGNPKDRKGHRSTGSF